MSAQRFDSPLRYQVDSHTRGETKHLVEIDAYDGAGKCSCEHFTFRLEPLLKQGNITPSDATRCHHIVEAREVFTDEVIKLIKQQQETNGTARKERQHA